LDQELSFGEIGVTDSQEGSSKNALSNAVGQNQKMRDNQAILSKARQIIMDHEE